MLARVEVEIENEEDLSLLWVVQMEKYLSFDSLFPFMLFLVFTCALASRACLRACLC